MRCGLQLQISFFGIGAVVPFQRALDIDRMGVVSFNEVAVVAIHGAHEIGQCRYHPVRQAAPKPCRCCCEFDHQVIQLGAVP